MSSHCLNNKFAIFVCIIEIHVLYFAGKHQWTDNAVKLLLASYSEHRGKFQSPCVRKHEVWKAISADLIEKGFLACTAEGCEKKFSNMKIR